MNQRRLISVAVLAIIQSACDSGGGGSASLGGASVSGTVPGTVIEAFGDNGSYYAVTSTNNGTTAHPFTLNAPAGVGFHMVMVTGEGTPDKVITPIGFRDSSGRVRTRLMLDNGEKVELGHVPLHMGRNEAADDDLDGDGVLDQPLILDDVGAGNPLSQSDVDDDDVNDWDDQDHGGYHYHSGTVDPQDHDDDGVPNVYDDDHVKRSNDRDGDGLPDHIDANPDNDPNHTNDALDDDCDADGYNDDDQIMTVSMTMMMTVMAIMMMTMIMMATTTAMMTMTKTTAVADGTTPPSPDQPPAVPPGPGTGLDGQALYLNNCTGSGCHSASGMRGRTASQITTAINNNRGGMGSIA